MQSPNQNHCQYFCLYDSQTFDELIAKFYTKNIERKVSGEF